MKLDKSTLHKIAHLSRLEIRPEEEKPLLESLTKILDFVEKLNELDTDDVEPLTHMTLETNQLRKDMVKPHLSHERALVNAPKADTDYFRVPKVIE